MKTSALVLPLMLGAVMMVSCEKALDDATPIKNTNTQKSLIAMDSPNDILENLSIQDGIIRSGGAPSSGSADRIPLITVPANIQFGPNGSSFNFSFEFSDVLSSGRAEKVHVWIPGSSSRIEIAITDIQLSSGAFSTPISLPDNIEEGNFTIAYALTDSDGNTSKTNVFDVFVNYVGHGDLLVSLSWDAQVDVDLILVEPDGTVLDFTNRESASGAKFKGDELFGFRPETVVYTSEPPNGFYEIKASFPNKPGEEPNLNKAPYILTLQIDGTPVRFTGWIEHGETFKIVDFNKTAKDNYEISSR
ncbi:MAG: hypothetical protein ACJAY8_001606 [Sphingobacteriales bacterium]|jgi:hypothetical protein